MDYNPNENTIQYSTMKINSIDPLAFMRLHRNVDDETVQTYHRAGQELILEQVRFTENQPNTFIWQNLGIEVSDNEFIGITSGISILTVLIILLTCICILSKRVRTVSCGLCHHILHWTKTFFCKLCVKQLESNVSNVAINGSDTTKNLDDMTSMLDTKLSTTPI